MSQATLARIFREDSGRVLATLIAQLRDFDLAEEALQDAITEALRVWPKTGVPDNGAAWLLTVARRRAIDRIRRSSVRNSELTQATLLQLAEDSDQSEADFTIPDERLRLIFTCCHPALSPEAQVALTLRTLCGLTAREIARALLTTETTMNQRLTRAKAKIRDAGIAYKVPEQTDIIVRLESVLSVIYLIYNESYSAYEGESLTRTDLANEAIRLAKILRHLLPLPEVSGLLALITLHNARREARYDCVGDMITLEDQDRNLWDANAIADGKKLLLHTLAARRPGPYQIQAAISALHSESPSWEKTDWLQITGLYTALESLTPSPVVSLNKAVAMANSGSLPQALEIVQTLAVDLSNYQPFYAARADLLTRSGQLANAREDYRRAIDLSKNAAEKAFLHGKLDDLG
ncbi:hypothetical protein A9Q96_06355 [Rhodobacterales bacterium 52_120_T64]|nr:hypothetical protein A9Q96_06355 [Rhodobacterales bacterium 52_120_T64]